jgi:hypothetical protein
MHPSSRAEAQRRADRIRAFRQELAALESEGASPLSTDQKAAIAGHHARVLADLACAFDVDRSDRAGHLSRGLRLASLFGAATLVAAVAALVHRYWGGLTLPAQVTLLTLFPLLSLAGVQAAAWRERTLYISSLFALTACGTAWVAIVQTARLLDLPLSVLILWPGILFGFAVAISHGFRSVLAVTLVALLVAVAGVFFAAGATPWTLALQRTEPLAVSAAALVLLSRHLSPGGPGFEATARVTGLVVGYAALLWLSSVERASLLPFAPATATAIHQALMLVATVGGLAFGIRSGEPATTNIAGVALATFLLIRYADWFWERLPAWAFFLFLAAASLAAIAFLRRLRGRVEPV